MPVQRHTLEELRALPHKSLADLALALERRCLELEETLAAHAQSPSSGTSMPRSAANGHGGEASPQLRAVVNEPEPEDADCAPPTRPGGTITLERALSGIPANQAAASQLRAELAQMIESMDASELGKELLRLTHSNFFLPDLRQHEPEFATYIRSRLITPYHQEALEEAEALNWAIGHDLPEEHRLHALWTQSDGNCLLHATLLAMWGLHDTQEVGTGGLSTLRAAMSRLFRDPKVAGQMRRRWAAQIGRDSLWEPKSQEKANADSGDGSRVSCSGHVEISEAQLARDWAEMVELAGRPSAFLDSVHVLALAHALRRPIVILASPMQRDPFGVPLTPIFFRGIYLPFEQQPGACCRQPLVLCFQDAHFMPLVPLDDPEGTTPVRVPLVDGRGEELPLRFALEEELAQRWELVARFLDIEPEVQLPKARFACRMALLRRDSSHPLVKEMMAHFVERGEVTFRLEQEEARRQSAARERSELKQKSPVESEAGKAKRLKLEAEDSRPLVAGGPNSSPRTSKENGNAARPKAAADTSVAISQRAEGEEPDADAHDRWKVRLPRGARPGDQSCFQMPKGCTHPGTIEFTVPKGSFEGDIVELNAKFKIKGHCIRALREVTNLSRKEAVVLLAKAHGDADSAARRYFERVPA